MEHFVNPAVEIRSNTSSSNMRVNDESAEDLLHELDKLSLSSGVNSKTIAKKLGELMKSAISIAISRKDDENENSWGSENKADFSQSDLDTIEKIDKLARAHNVNLFSTYFGKSIVHPLCTDLFSQQFHKLVQLMIRLGKEDIFQIQDSERGAAVHLAIRKNASLLPETIDLLAKKCYVDFTIQNNQGNNLVHLASKKQSLVVFQRIVKYFEGDFNGDLNTRNKSGHTALHQAARTGNPEILQYFASLKGLDVNAKNNWKQTPLFSLFSSPADNFIKNLNILVKAGADINAVDKHGRSIIFYVVFHGLSSEVAHEIVRSGCKFNWNDNLGRTLLHVCVEKDKINLLKYFVRLGINVNKRDNNQGRTAMHTAAAEKNINAFECLVSNGGDVNLKDLEGDTPLTLILKSDTVTNSDLSLNAIQMLIKYQKKLDGRNNNIGKLLLFAAKKRMTNTELKEIVDLVVDLTIVNEKGQSLLHSVTTVGNVELVKYLISKGADVNKKDFQGRTPLHFCVASKDDASLDVVDFDVVNVLLTYGANIWATDFLGLNVLLLAAKSGREWMKLERLLNLGASCNVTDALGDSILHILAKEGNVNALNFFLSLGVNPNGINLFKETPLHFAKDAKKNFIETVIVLKRYGAKLDTVDLAGQSPFQVAMIAGRSPNEFSFLLNSY